MNKEIKNDQDEMKIRIAASQAPDEKALGEQNPSKLCNRFNSLVKSKTLSNFNKSGQILFVLGYASCAINVVFAQYAVKLANVRPQPINYIYVY